MMIMPFGVVNLVIPSILFVIIFYVKTTLCVAVEMIYQINYLVKNIFYSLQSSHECQTKIHSFLYLETSN